MSRTLDKLLSEYAMRQCGDNFRAKIAPRERNRATFEIQFGDHKVCAVGFPVTLQTFDYEFERRSRAASFATAALAELMEDMVLPLVSKYYESAYAELGLHYPKRYQFPIGTDMCRKSIPRFRVMEDFGLTVRAPNPILGRYLV